MILNVIFTSKEMLAGELRVAEVTRPVSPSEGSCS